MEELKETEANPWVLLGREEMAGGGGSAVDSEAAVEALVGGGVPVGIGRGGGEKGLKRNFRNFMDPTVNQQ